MGSDSLAWRADVGQSQLVSQPSALQSISLIRPPLRERVIISRNPAQLVSRVDRPTGGPRQDSFPISRCLPPSRRDAAIQDTDCTADRTEFSNRPSVVELEYITWRQTIQERKDEEGH